MLSYWEQQSFTRYDHIVAGAGIVGLSTAIELTDRYPTARVVVLERGLLPTGASSRNAGFACMGSVTELLDDLQHTDESEVYALYEWRKKGLERLRARLGDATIGYTERGSYELIGDHEADSVDKIAYLNKLLLPLTQKPAFRMADEKITEFGFSKVHTRHLIENTCEGELNTGMMMRALTDKAMAAGVEIKTGCEIIAFAEEKEGVAVEVRGPYRKDILTLKGKSLTLCTNAFTKQLLPEEEVRPGRGQVLITEQIEDLPFTGIYHFDKGYYYFREIDGRILLGGGRNMDFEGETTTLLELSNTIQDELERKLREVIIPGREYKIAQRWAGIMAFGNTKYPVVKAFSDRIFGAYRMGGMGVALGSEVASQIADMVRGRN